MSAGSTGPVKMRRRAAAAALPALAVLIAACSSTSAANTGSTTSSVATSSTTSTTSIPATTSTTTTTLPLPVGAGGPSIFRVRVATLPPNTAALPSVSPASAAWLAMVPIAFRSFGSGPDLLLVGGQDGTLAWWNPALLSDLSRHYHVTVFDLPGAGYSGPPTAPMSLGWLADVTAGFALTAGLAHPVVLGWGLGGEIALSLVERHPGLASSLVLVDTSGGAASAPQPAQGVVSRLELPGATPVALSPLLFPRTDAGLRERRVWQNSLLGGTPDWLTAQAVRGEARVQAAIWKRSPLTAGLFRVRIPALVVSGADDIVFPPENASLLAGELPHATLVMIADAGYGAIDQYEAAFVDRMEKFTG